MNWWVFAGVAILMWVLHPEIELGDNAWRRVLGTALVCAIPAILIGLGT